MPVGGARDNTTLDSNNRGRSTFTTVGSGYCGVCALSELSVVDGKSSDLKYIYALNMAAVMQRFSKLMSWLICAINTH